jgi:hypothetical protein
MTAVLVDSNVLLDVMTEDPSWLSWSAEAIEQTADSYRLVINPLIYAEISIRYSRIENSTRPCRKLCSTENQFPMQLLSSQPNRSWPIGGEGEPDGHRCLTFPSARTRLLRYIG